MTSQPLLMGKVHKWSLPVIEGTPTSDLPKLKRLLLPQGELAQFYDEDEGIRYIAFAQLQPGKVRGNHYHQIKNEMVYVINGEVLLALEDIGSHERATTVLKTGDLVLIPTLIAHALRPIVSGEAIEFSTARFNATDVHRFPLI